MTPRGLRNITLAACVMACLYALVVAIIVLRCECSEPATLECMAWKSRADTVWKPHRTSLTDTLNRLDSIIRVRQERRR